MKDELLTIEQAAKLLNVSTKTMRRWDMSGKLSPKRTIGNHRRYTKSEIEAFMKQSGGGVPGAGDTSQTSPVQAAMPSPGNANLVSFFAAKETKTSEPVAEVAEDFPQISVDEENQAPHLPRTNFSRRGLAMAFTGVVTMLFLLSAAIFTVPHSRMFAQAKQQVSNFLPGADEPVIPTSTNPALAVRSQNGKQPVYDLKVNVPAFFGKKTTFLDDVEIKKSLTVDGKLKAPNVVYSLVAGQNVSISGDPQRPTISAGVTGGVSSFAGQTGAIALTTGSGIAVNGLQVTNTGVLSVQGQSGNVQFSGGSGISLSGTTITNADPGSAQNIFKTLDVNGTDISAGSNADTVNFAAGSGVTLSGDSGSKTITISAPGSAGSQWTTTGSNIYYNLGNVGIGTTNPTSALDVNGNGRISGSLTLSSLGTGLVQSNGSGLLSAAALIGTANQISVNNSGGNITLATPQNIHTAATPTFAGLTLTSSINQLTLGTGNTGVISLGALTTGRTYTLPNQSGVICVDTGNCTGVGGSLTGSGTQFRIARFSSSSGLEDSSIYDNGQVGIGTTSPQGLFSVFGAVSGKALVSLNQTGNQDIFVASTSGTTRFVIANDGSLTASKYTAGIAHFNGSGAVTSGQVGLSSEVSGTLPVGNGGTGVGSFTANGVILGGLTLGSTAAGTDGQLLLGQTGSAPAFTALTGDVAAISNLGAVTLKNVGTVGMYGSASQVPVFTTDAQGRITTVTPTNIAIDAAAIISGTLGANKGGTGVSSYNKGDLLFANSNNPIALTALPIGGGGQILTVSGGVPVWSDAGGTINFFQRANGAIAPFALSDDLLVGGNATSSAKFQIFGTTGNATSSGNLTFSSAASIQTTNAQNLTLGGSSTGNIIFTPQNGAGTVLVNGALNLASGNVYQINGTPVLSANALGSNVVSSQLTSVGTLNAGSISTGFGNIDVGTDSIGGGDFTSVGTTGFTSSGVDADFTFSAVGNHDIIASAGVLRLGAFTLIGDVTGNNHSITGLNNLSAGGSVTFGGFSSNGGVLYTDNTGLVAQATAGTIHQVLHGGVVPAFSAIDLTADITGILGVGNGGTGKATAPTNGQLLIGNGTGYNLATISQGSGIDVNSGAGTITISNTGVLSIAGTASQINASGNTGAVVLSLPQNIDNAATPTFASLSLTANVNALTLGSGNTGVLTLGTLTSAQTYTLPNLSGTVCLTVGNCAGSGSGVTAPVAGTNGRLSKFTGSQSIGNSSINDLSNSIALTIDASGNLGVGNTNPKALLDVVGGSAGGNAAAIFNQTGASTNDILSASSSGTTQFVINNNGTIQFTGGSGFLTTLTSTASSSGKTYNLPSFGGSTADVCLSIGNCSGLGGSLSGSGANGQLAFFTGTSSIVSDNSLFFDSTNKLFGIGNATPVAKLDVAGAVTGKALAIFNQTGNQDIFTASASGTTRFTIANDGTVTASKYTTNNGLLYTNASGVISQATAGTDGQLLLGHTGAAPAFTTLTGDIASVSNTGSVTLKNVGTANTYGSVSQVPVFTTDAQGRITTVTPTNIAIDAAQIISGTLGTTNGGTGIGSYAKGDLLFASAANTLSARTIGNPGQILTISGGVPVWSDAGGTINFFQKANGAVAPLDITNDLLLGSTSTSSAAFAFKNVAGGTPTASISAGINGGVYLDATGVLATTAKQSLTLGDANTGAIVVHGLSTGVVHTDAGGVLLSGLVTNTELQNNSITINTGTGLSGGATVALGNSISLANTGVTSALAGTGIGLSAGSGAVTINNSGVLSLNSGAGALSLNNAGTAAGGAITINDASTSQKGIAQFNSTNFSDNGSGTINTTQNINNSAAPTFAGLTLTNATNQLILGTTNTITLNASTGTSRTYTIPDFGSNDTFAGIAATQTLTNKTLLDTSTIFQNSVTSSKKLQFDLSNVQASTTLSLGVPTSAGTSDVICLQNKQNCVGTGGGVTATGANANQLAFFTGTQTISSDSTLFFDNTKKLFGVGNATPVAKLDVAGAVPGKALAIFNETGDQALFTASASGATEFTIDHSGNVAAAGSINGLSLSKNANGFSIAGGTISKLLTVTGSDITLTGGGNTLTLSGNASLNQDLLNSSSPTFAALQLSGSSNQLVLNSAGVIGTLSWTPTTSNKTITFPDATGIVCLNSGNCSGTTNYFQLNSGVIAPGNAALANSQLVLGGNTSTPYQFEVNGKQTGKALVSFNETGNQDIFTASASGTTRFTIANDGTITASKYSAGVTHFNGSGALYSGQVALGSEVSGTLGAGNGGTGISTYAGGDLLMGNGSNTLSALPRGAAGQFLTISGTTLAWTDPGGAINFWQKANGAVAPLDITNDLLLGSTATSSAKFAFMNVAGGTPTASISANTTNNAAYLTGDGTLGTTNAQTLTLGSASTGDISFRPGGVSSGNSLYLASSGNVGIGTNNPGALLDVKGSSTGRTLVGILADVTTYGAIGFASPLNSSTYALAGNGTTETTLNAPSGGILDLRIGGIEKIRLAANGSLGIGTTTPLATLDVRGNSGTTPVASVSGNTAFAGLVVDNSGVGDIFTASQAGTTKFTITNGGNLALAAGANIDTLTSGNLNIGTGANTNTLTFGQSGHSINLAGYSGCGMLTTTGTTLTCSSAPTGTNYWQDNSNVLAPGGSALPGSQVVFGGNTATNFQFEVNGKQTGKALVSFNETGDQAIFTASASGTNRFVIQNNGNVGLGMTTPNDLLSLNTATGAKGIGAYYDPNTYNIRGYITHGGNSDGINSEGGLQIASQGTNNSTFGSGAIKFFTPTGNSAGAFTDAPLAVRMTIAQSGNVGIGDTTPAALFTVGNGDKFQVDSNGNVTGGTYNGVTPNFAADGFTIAGGTTPRTLTVTGSNVSLNQDLLTTSSPTFANLTDSGLSASSAVYTNISKQLTTTAPTSGAIGYWTRTGTNLSPSTSTDTLSLGTTTPLATLDVRGNSGTTPAASISANTAFAAQVVDNSGVGDLFTASKSGATKFVINNAGNVGINTADPTNLLDITAQNVGGSGLTFYNPGRTKSLSISYDTSNIVFSSSGQDFISTSNFYMGNKTLYAANSLGIGGSGSFPTNSTVDIQAKNVGGGTISVASISGATSFASTVIDQSGVGDIFTASKSGASKFTILNNGNIQANSYTAGGGLLYTDGTGLFKQLADIATGSCLISQGAGNSPTWGSCATGTTNYLQRTGTTLSPSLGNDSLLLADTGNTTNYRLEVNGKQTGKALAVFNETGDQNILVGSASGQTQFTFDRSGNLSLAAGAKLDTLSSGTLGIGTSNVTILTLGKSSGTTINLPSLGSQNNSILFANTTANGALTAVAPTSLANQCLLSGLNTAAPSWGTCPGASSTNYWQENSFAVAPLNIADDLLLGSTATTSAKFAFKNVAGGVPVASISANTTNNATFLTGDGNLGTTDAQTLTLGGVSTGNIIISPANGTGVTTNTGSFNLPTGKSYQINGVPVLSEGSLGGGVLASSLTSVGILNSGSISSGFGAIDIGGDNLTAGGTINFAGLGTNKALFVDGSSNLTTSAASSILAASLTDETGTGVAVFGTSPTLTSPTITTSLVPGSTSFDLANTVATTLNLGGAAATFNIGPTGATAASIKLAGGAGATGCTVDGATGNITCDGTVIGSNITAGSSLSGSNTGDVTLNGTGENYLTIAGQVIKANQIDLNSTNVKNILPIANGGTGSNTQNFVDLTTVQTAAGAKTWSGLGTFNAGISVAANQNLTLAAGTGSVGIGTAGPTATLDVRGNSGTTPIESLSGTTAKAGVIVDNAGVGDLFTASAAGATKFVIANNGNVGIGGAPLITGLTINQTTAQANIELKSNNNLQSAFNFSDNTNGANFDIYRPANSRDLRFFSYEASKDALTILSASGNVGIGTNNPGTALDVNGRINGTGYSGGGLADCKDTAGANNSVEKKLNYNASTKQFSCANSGASVLITKPSDQTIPNTSMTSDNDFTFSIGANETYIFEITANATFGSGKIKYRLAAPSGSTCSVSGIGADTSGSGADLINGGCNTSSLVTGSSSPSVLQLWGSVTTGATPGSVTIQWAQNSLSGTTIVKAGSSMVAYKVSGADVAEAYYTKDATIQPGDIVQADGSLTAGVKKTDQQYDTRALGIISTKPGVVLGDSTINEGRPVLLALNGRVPVKIASNSAAIQAGDLLTTSDEPGKAMKSMRAGQVIGKALESWTPGSGKETVLTFLNVSYGVPEGDLNADGNMILNGQALSSDSLQTAISKVQTTVTNISDQQASSSAQFKTLTNQQATDSGRLTSLESNTSSLSAQLSSLQNRVASLEANQNLFASGSALLNNQLGDFSAANAQQLGLEKLDVKDATVSNTLSVLGRTTLSDVGITGKVNIGLLNINGLDSLGSGSSQSYASINTSSGPLKLQSDGYNGIDILGGKVTIDTSGNLISQGAITVQKLNIATPDATSASVGHATIPQGQTKVVVSTASVTKNSHIFTSLESLTDIPLVVTKKDPGNSFTVEIKKSTSADLNFSWWVVN